MTGLVFSLTIAISAAIGAIVAIAWLGSTAAFYRTRVRQLSRRLEAFRVQGDPYTSLIDPTDRRPAVPRGGLERTRPD